MAESRVSLTSEGTAEWMDKDSESSGISWRVLRASLPLPAFALSTASTACNGRVGSSVIAEKLHHP
jgi:hypothetical protein